MDNNNLQQRAFILSSLRRLNISISTYAYRFVDKIIRDGWMPSLGSLDEVDVEVQVKFWEFMNEQR
jgi:hypothetical protein